PCRDPLGLRSTVDRGVPGRVPRDVPPRLRSSARGGGRAGVELRRLRYAGQRLPCRREQEGGLHPRPPTEGRSTYAPSPLARMRSTRSPAPSTVNVDLTVEGA